MPLHLTDPRLRALFDPLGPLAESALAALGGAALPITLGDVAGFYALVDERVVLSERLITSGTHHPDEPPFAPLDRWRRALCSALEAQALYGLARATGRPPADDWRWLGWAIDAAARAAPGLGLGLPELALAHTTGAPGATPRAGAAVLWAWRAMGEDAPARALAAIAGEDPSPSEWLRLAARVDAAEGVGAALPADADRPAPLSPPEGLGPWSWRRVRVTHPRGGVLSVIGAGELLNPWVQGGEEHRTLFATTAGGALSLAPGGPTGRWALRSLHGFGKVMGARGTAIEFMPDGRLEFVLADSFVGPIEALGVAATMGTSGTVVGRWRVSGPAALRMSGLHPIGLTVHGRGGVAMPAAGEREGWIAEIQTAPWRWTFEDQRLVLRGTMFGNAVELRLGPDD